MITNFVERLRFLIDTMCAGKSTVFAKKAGIAPGTFAAYLGGRLPQAEQLIRIHETYGIDLTWLLTGHGSVYADDSQNDSLDNIESPLNICEDVENISDEVSDLLIKAKKVLTSGNDVAFRALQYNINYFDRAISAEQRAKLAEIEIDQAKQEATEARRVQEEMKNQLASMEERIAKMEQNLAQKKARLSLDEASDLGENEAI